jgi:hypothetical protein
MPRARYRAVDSRSRPPASASMDDGGREWRPHSTASRFTRPSCRSRLVALHVGPERRHPGRRQLHPAVLAILTSLESAPVPRSDPLDMSTLPRPIGVCTPQGKSSRPTGGGVPAVPITQQDRMNVHASDSRGPARGPLVPDRPGGTTPYGQCRPEHPSQVERPFAPEELSPVELSLRPRPTMQFVRPHYFSPSP